MARQFRYGAPGAWLPTTIEEGPTEDIRLITLAIPEDQLDAMLRREYGTGALHPDLEAEMKRQRVLHAGGRERWAGGYFTGADHFTAEVGRAMRALLAADAHSALTQDQVLAWWADHGDDRFRRCDIARMSEWCRRAQVRWAALKAAGRAEFRAGFA